jgi:hypothetical protein
MFERIIDSMREFLTKLIYNVSGGVYGLLSIMFGIVGDIIAVILYPGYDFTKSAVSTLCKGPGWFFFQSGTVLSGIFAVFFVISLSKSFNEDEVSKKFNQMTLIAALISCTTFIGLGFFCGSDPIVALIHGTCAVITWISGITYITSFNIMMKKDSQFSKFLVYIGFLTSFILFSMVVLFFLHFFPDLRFLMFILPTIEWLNTISLTIWYFVISTYMIFKKI